MIRKGFTVIEFFFSLLVIAILIGSALISSREAQTTAEANNIINDMANIRIAYSVLYGERDNEINIADINKVRDTFKISDITKYISGNKTIIEEYSLYIDDSASWYILSKASEDPRVRKKIAGHAVSSGLLGGDGKNFTSLETYSNQDYVIIQLR